MEGTLSGWQPATRTLTFGCESAQSMSALAASFA